MLLLKKITADSCIECYNYEVFTDFVWPLNFYNEKNNGIFFTKLSECTIISCLLL